MLIKYRIRNVFPSTLRLRFEWIPKFLGSSPCSPTRPHQISSHRVYVVFGSELTDHESRFISGGPHNEPEAARESDDQGSIDCTT